MNIEIKERIITEIFDAQKAPLSDKVVSKSFIAHAELDAVQQILDHLKTSYQAAEADSPTASLFLRRIESLALARPDKKIIAPAIDIFKEAVETGKGYHIHFLRAVETTRNAIAKIWR